jgi:NADH:ubiquinone oxidoreductase subunit E
MSTDVRCCCEDVTEEQKLALISEYIEANRNQEGNLIQVLHFAQEIYGFLPVSLMRFIADKMDKPLSEVSGVVSFYSFFSTKPKGKNIIRICLGTACYVRGGKRILDRLEEILGIGPGDTTDDRVFSLEVMRCIGACGLAPAIMINDTVYKQVNPDKINDILSKYYDGKE